MEHRQAGREGRCGDEDTLLQTLLSDYRHARTVLEGLTRDFQAREALLMSRVPGEKPTWVTQSGPAPIAQANAPSPAVALFCLGKFRIEIGGKLLDTRGYGKSLAILKFLVRRGQRPTPRDVLLEALWSDSDAEAAGNRLRVAVHGLRQLLATADCQPDMVIHRQGCYLLNPSAPVWVDADVFEGLWQRGAHLERQHSYKDAAAMYAQAEILYAGDYLEEDLYEEWTLLRREGLRDAYLDLLGKLATWSLTDRDYGGCIVRCQKILAQDCCREDAYRLLIRCHTATGQRARALRWYEICAATLRRELEMLPSPETVSLHRRLLQGEPL